jgi:hypothetical protein
MKANVARAQVLNQLLIRGDFDLELHEFKLKVMMQIINILSSFLAFVSFYNQTKAHNMLAIMLGLCLKNMKVI